MTRYVRPGETSRLIRKLLKRSFPATKFHVWTHTYAGGASINVTWDEGPAYDEVDAMVRPFAGSGFDGMIDMAYSVEAFLTADGRAFFAQTTGTEGSGGDVPAPKTFKPTPDAERVCFCVDHVFCRRRSADLSRRLARAAGVIAAPAALATEPTQAGLQYVIPGCERDQSRGPAQLSLF